MNFPCGTFPVCKIEEEDQSFSDHYEDRWTNLLRENASDSAGMPICLQVVCHAQEDEKVLGILKVLEQNLNYKVRIPDIVEEDENHIRLKSFRATVIPEQVED